MHDYPWAVLGGMYNQGSLFVPCARHSSWDLEDHITDRPCSASDLCRTAVADLLNVQWY